MIDLEFLRIKLLSDPASGYQDGPPDGARDLGNRSTLVQKKNLRIKLLSDPASGYQDGPPDGARDLGNRSTSSVV